MDEDIRLCMGCMNELDEEGVCHYCSYTDDIPHLQSYLAPHTVLNNRYIVGKLLSYNGEGASYICYDMVSKSKAILSEYMPNTLCEREMNSNNIVINADCLAKYKTYMSEFMDMNRTLTRMRNLKSICTAKDMFSENNTCYVILEYVEGVSLKKFLQANRGYLRWEQVRKLFMPLFTTLSIIHNAGIIHRGISPENIIVTTQGTLKLTGFSISSIRTSGTALQPEFYSGFTAPEQYSSLEWQGTWTDVYSIGAVLYRILTGYVPPDAFNRMNNDTLIPANRINPHIPRHVSNVLMHAMKVRSSERIPSINDLVGELFDNVPQPTPHVKGATQTIPVVKPEKKTERSEQPRRSSSDRQSSKAAEAKKSSAGALTAAAFVLLALMLILGIMMLYQVFTPQENDDSVSNFPVTNAPEDDDESEILVPATQVTTSAAAESTEESPYGEGAIMPNLVGQRLETIERELGDAFTIRTKTFYSNTDTKGVVYSQSIPAGVDYDPARLNELTLEVCVGPSLVPIPEYRGYSKKEYLDKLTEAGIIYVVSEVYSDETEEGMVIKTEPDSGTQINIEEGETLFVYVSLGPEPDSSSELDGADYTGSTVENEWTDTQWDYDYNFNGE